MNRFKFLAFGVLIALSCAFFACVNGPADVTLTFDTDGGSIVESQTIKSGSKPQKVPDPTWDGYSFDGWFVGNAEFSFENALTENTTVKARWTQLFTVTFVFDNGTANKVETVRKGASVAEPAAVTKTGYKFLGWYNGAVKYVFSASVNSAITITAKWTDQAVVTFSDGTVSNPTDVTIGQKAVRPAVDPDYPDKIFKGWKLNGQDFDFNTIITDDITLTAAYADAVNVTYVYGNGTPNKTDKIEKGSTVSQPAAITRTGYKFLGWFNGSEGYTFGAAVNASITLTAHWTDKITVTFVAGSVSTPVEVTIGQKVSKPADPAETEDNIFKSWRLNGVNYDFNTVMTETTDNFTLTAYFAEAVKVTIVYGNGDPDTVQKIEKGTKAEKPANPGRGGYAFAGWYNGGISFDFNANVNASITVTAKWDNTVTFAMLEGIWVGESEAYDSQFFYEFIIAGNGTVTGSYDSNWGLTEIEIESAVIEGDRLIIIYLEYGNAKTMTFRYASSQLSTSSAIMNEELALSKTLFAVVRVTIIFGNGEPNMVQRIEKGTKAEAPITPSRDGYAFGGWYNGGISFDFNANVNASVTVTAKWDNTVTFAMLEGTWVGNSDAYGMAADYEFIIGADGTVTGLYSSIYATTVIEVVSAAIEGDRLIIKHLEYGLTSTITFQYTSSQLYTEMAVMWEELTLSKSFAWASVAGVWAGQGIDASDIKYNYELVISAEGTAAFRIGKSGEALAECTQVKVSRDRMNLRVEYKLGAAAVKTIIFAYSAADTKLTTAAGNSGEALNLIPSFEFSQIVGSWTGTSRAEGPMGETSYYYEIDIKADGSISGKYYFSTYSEDLSSLSLVRNGLEIICTYYIDFPETGTIKFSLSDGKLVTSSAAKNETLTLTKTFTWAEIAGVWSALVEDEYGDVIGIYEITISSAGMASGSYFAGNAFGFYFDGQPVKFAGVRIIRNGNTFSFAISGKTITFTFSGGIITAASGVANEGLTFSKSFAWSEISGIWTGWTEAYDDYMEEDITVFYEFIFKADGTAAGSFYIVEWDELGEFENIFIYKDGNNLIFDCDMWIFSAFRFTFANGKLTAPEAYFYEPLELNRSFSMAQVAGDYVGVSKDYSYKFNISADGTATFKYTAESVETSLTNIVLTRNGMQLILVSDEMTIIFVFDGFTLTTSSAVAGEELTLDIFKPVLTIDDLVGVWTGTNTTWGYEYVYTVTFLSNGKCNYTMDDGDWPDTYENITITISEMTVKFSFVGSIKTFTYTNGKLETPAASLFTPLTLTKVS